ncbi:hypothetical protein EDD21DRAFT_350491 [Dissophora ornata]|nr:hypothetical protein EDD21DRAFT_350491 [Dissophora ornata]
MEHIKLLVQKHVLDLCLANGHPVLSPLSPFLMSKLKEAYESLDIEQDWNLEIGDCLGRVADAVLEGVADNSDRWHELWVDVEMHTSRLLIWCITTASFSYKGRGFVHTLVELRHQSIFTGEQHVSIESCFCGALHFALRKVAERSKEWCKVAMDTAEAMSKILKAHVTADYWGLSQDSKDLVQALATVSLQSIYGRAYFAIPDDGNNCLAGYRLLWNSWEFQRSPYSPLEEKNPRR